MGLVGSDQKSVDDELSATCVEDGLYVVEGTYDSDDDFFAPSRLFDEPSDAR